MRNFRFFLIVLLFATSNAFGQWVKVSGVIIDTQRHLPIYNATVSSIRAKDSVLVAFTRTKKDGSFSMRVPDSTFYNFTANDTKTPGRYMGEFSITTTEGELIVPIRESLFINITPSFIKTQYCC